MTSGICTLFEDHYHYGVAALTNSVYSQGYKGAIYAGFRGVLPAWASSAKENLSIEWPGSRTLKVANDLHIHFLPLNTNYHLTNYKPDFMLRLLGGPAKECGALFYFDPDIIVTAPWTFFNDWVNCGIALCEDVNSPLAEHHPRRMAWRRYFGSKDIELTYRECTYANGGFLGIRKSDLSFLEMWQRLQVEMSPVIGGLHRSALSGPPLLFEADGPFAPFGKTDQDALNATVEAWTGKISFIGKEGMAFKSGLAIMPHALGQPKPWKWKPLTQALAGSPPRVVDREYWKAANSTILTQPLNLVRHRKLCINIAAFIGRFYRRGGNSEY